ncbi:MAG: hypothetical protein Q8P18_00730 [Pseudomonadota bacterium]|nr:hypothetical protein [Pseudomonadota bacterium]
MSVLDGISDWRTSAAAELDQALAAINEEERAVRRRIEDAQRQFAALGSIRREQEERLLELEEETLRRKRAGVRYALELDRAVLEERAVALRAARERHDAALGAGLDAPEMAEAINEYLDARERTAGLRGSLVSLPEELLTEPARARLDPYLRAAAAAPPPLSAPWVGVGVVVSVDPPEGRPEALLVVLPVPWAVYADVVHREEDLCTSLAYRMVAALHVLLAEVGAPDALVRFDDLQGSLAIQVWLGDTPVVVDLRERVMEAVAGAVEGAAELQAAALEVYAVWLAPDLLVEAAP